MDERKVREKIKNIDVYSARIQTYVDRAKTISFVVTALYSDARIALIFPSGKSLAVWIALGIFSVLCIFAQVHSRKQPGYSAACPMSVLVSGLYSGFVLYHLTSLLVSDIAYLVARGITRGAADHDIFSLLALLSGIAIVAYGWHTAHSTVLTRYHVRTPEHPVKRPYRVVQLSDLHIGAVVGAPYIRKIVRMTNACHPDLVVITGDILNHASLKECRQEDEIASLLAEIKTPDGVYAVRGNHDPDPEDPEYKAFLIRSDIRSVDNSTAETDVINIVGRTGVLTPAYDRKPLEDLMKKTNPLKPTLVLDHDPKGIRTAENNGADLILCGHTHDGQMFPMNYFTRYYYGKKYVYGYSREGKTQSIVSSGTGFFQTPIRVGTRSEIVCIDWR